MATDDLVPSMPFKVPKHLDSIKDTERGNYLLPLSLHSNFQMAIFFPLKWRQRPRVGPVSTVMFSLALGSCVFVSLSHSYV